MVEQETTYSNELNSQRPLGLKFALSPFRSSLVALSLFALLQSIYVLVLSASGLGSEPLV